jgi:3-oxoacyl-[acyl-carrier-protein] synthase-3
MLQVYQPPPEARETGIGISSIALYQPPRTLPNSWYESLLAKKFEKHTGICCRSISDEDEVALAAQAIGRLVDGSGCRLDDCAALLFVSPSLIPQSVARKHLSPEMARREQPSRLARELAQSLNIAPRRVIGMNGFCSGYAKALASLQHRVRSQLMLGKNEFVLLVTSSRISRITDYQCRASGALFGDFATATLISRRDSIRYPVHFDLLDAQFEKQTSNQAFFNFAVRDNVLVPTRDGNREYQPRRVVFSLDGMGIADTAPRAMAQAAADMVKRNRLAPDQIDCIVPHQAGRGIVRLTGMKLEQAGFAVEPINGHTTQTGNISSSSVPHALKQQWDSLHGRILCPVAAVGAPGKAEVSRGCILLRRQSRSKAMAG